MMLLITQQVLGISRCSNNASTTVFIENGRSEDCETELSPSRNIGAIVVGAFLLGLLFLSLLTYYIKKWKWAKDENLVTGIAGLFIQLLFKFQE